MVSLGKPLEPGKAEIERLGGPVDAEEGAGHVNGGMRIQPSERRADGAHVHRVAGFGCFDERVAG